MSAHKQTQGEARTSTQLLGEIAAIYVRLMADKADDALYMALTLLTDEQIAIAQAEYEREEANDAD